MKYVGYPTCTRYGLRTFGNVYCVAGRLYLSEKKKVRSIHNHKKNARSYVLLSCRNYIVWLHIRAYCMYYHNINCNITTLLLNVHPSKTYCNVFAIFTSYCGLRRMMHIRTDMFDLDTTMGNSLDKAVLCRVPRMTMYCYGNIRMTCYLQQTRHTHLSSGNARLRYIHNQHKKPQWSLYE